MLGWMGKAVLTAMALMLVGEAAIADDQVPAAAPPGGTQCNDFARLAAEAQKRSALVGAAMKAKADRKELCTLIISLVAAETDVVKFLETNKVWCGVPDAAIKASKANHEKSIKFRTATCAPSPNDARPILLNDGVDWERSPPAR